MNPKEATFKNIPVTKESIQAWVRQDMHALYSFAHEILQDKEIQGMIAERFYQRYLKQQAEEEANLMDEQLKQDASV